MKQVTAIAALLLGAAWFLGAQKAEYETRTSVGQPLPAFTVTDSAGKTFDTAAMKGRVMVVNFWATWCGPCRSEIPRLEKEIWEAHKADGLIVIGISRGEQMDLVKGFVAKNGMTYQIAVDPDRKIYDRFASAGIPRSYVVGRDGKITFQSLGYQAQEFDQLKAAVQHELTRASN